ncbi:MAG: hypothetical protein ACR65T_01660 [Methylocystis sp.]|uniref:hypothetical protein n=1 Tax=Methylocystis sp. TaxID=1911079 RepID=UPI003DA5DA31
MNRKVYILVFSPDAAWVHTEAKPIAGILNDGDGIYVLDGNILFLKTAQNVETLTERLKSSLTGKAQFFLADVSETARAGNMAPKFWSYLREAETLAPAA